MTKQETIQIMAMLGAFYSGGKNDPRIQAEAWYLILKKYDFETAKVAVLKFAENDTRDYATFPAVGKIVEAIRIEEKARMKPIYEIKMSISHGRRYEDIDTYCKSLITKDMYNEWLSMDAELFEQKSSKLIEALKNENRNRLTAGI